MHTKLYLTMTTPADVLVAGYFGREVSILTKLGRSEVLFLG